MSIRQGNKFFREGRYADAIREYQKINRDSPLYVHAEANIARALFHSKSSDAFEKRIPQSTADADICEPAAPLVSIIMPVFNVAPYLDASLLTVLSQELKDFELIIVNDASTDNSANIIQMYASMDPRVRVVHLQYNTLGGAGIPSNVGMKLARGRYIGFVDSDDWVTPNGFRELVECAQESDADVVIGDFCTFIEDSREVSVAYDKKSWAALPINKVISASTYPDLLRLSPVPWRKLYKRTFVEKNHTYYPEGDYFYEDNPLHWFVLSRAERVVLTDAVISYHRMAREGQTMSSASYKLAAMCSHVNTIARHLSKPDVACQQALVDEFYDYCYRSSWVVDRQENGAVRSLVAKRLSNIFQRHCNKMPPAKLRENFKGRFNNYQAAYPSVDLTVVIPAHNCADLISETVASLYQLNDISFNVLIIDDGSTDGTFEVCDELSRRYAGLHVFQQGNKGAGRARNALIPLCTGLYTYFLDADDVIDARNLSAAVKAAKSENSDLHFFKYRIEYFDAKKSRGMFDADEGLWKELKSAVTHDDRRNIVAGLINYPWNRIIKTDFLHDENIFFGPTVVHNDIPYHWHSVVAAEKITYTDEPVCTHRKFESREQITNITDRRRMMVFEALRVTQASMEKYAQFSDLIPKWIRFSEHLIDWAERRIPKDALVEYAERAESFKRSLPVRK
ncbi:glycosyltransferase family 2 protein [Cupriavidus gilardii]|jgi:glycosyltransferase involved in cell wall biosynthesis|uniref:glycosyltransferase family 2 protein n=1 Tax=Cupriavidus gilardii TaxID=82541 RepID=UPI0015803323|nr:glycosyltransferase family 2 protein [Cupriavidus gilardii]QKS64250.1 glycosyltransferase [Cupriavidus gilardii]